MDEWNGTQEEDSSFDSSSLDQNNNNNKWVESVDTATIVSIGSSCVILISGCIAVVCLILYMKKSEQQMQRFREQQQLTTTTTTSSPFICGKCGANVSLNKRSIGLQIQTNDNNSDNNRLNDSALYAISGANFENSKNEDSLLGIICGHVSDTQTTTYSTNQNDIHLKRLNICLNSSQCSSSRTHDSELIYELSRVERCPKFEFELYESINGSEERETPTDPGIRQFTESPPKPNERRQGVVQHIQNESQSTTPTNESFEQNFGAIPRYRSRKPQWKLSTQSQTIKCLSSLTSATDFEVNGLSSDESDDDDSDDHFTPPKKSIDC